MNREDTIAAWLKEKHKQCTDRTFVTLSYAQSIDGSIALKKDKPLHMSCQKIQVLSHQIRSQHDALLVGIGTILADDPQLTVRHVAGENPQPVILDSALRFPINSRVLEHEPKPWIFTNDRASKVKKNTLEKIGVRVLRAKANDQNQIDIAYVIRELYFLGVTSLLVEGGAKVISHFIRQKSVDATILFLTPIFVGGLNPLQLQNDQHSILPNDSGFPRMRVVGCIQVDTDIVIWGDYCMESC